LENYQNDLFTFRTIIESSPFPVSLYQGDDMIVTIANAATLKAWGKTRDVIGRPFHEVLPELKNQPFKQLLLDVYHSGIAHSARDQRADIVVNGTLQTFYFTFSYQPFKDQFGKTTGVFSFANDVTELVLARLHLAATEESARLAIEAARLGTFDIDLVSGEMSWNTRCRELFGITHENELTYDNDFLPALHPEDREQVRNYISTFAFVKVISNGDYDIEYRTVGAKDKKMRWIKSRGTVFFNDDEMPMRFIGTVLDITDIKEAGEKSARLSAIIQSSYDAIISKNLDGTIDSWNVAAERMFGYTSDEMVGQSIFKIIPAENVHEEIQILFRLENGERVEHFETKRLKEDGKLLDVSLTISPIKNDKNEITGLSTIARDITEQKMAETRKNDFITIASHELKTPLTTIKSFVQLLLSKAHKDQDNFRIDALSKVEKHANKMSILIQNFLNNAKLLEGKFDLKLERFNTHDLLNEVVQDAKMLSPTHKLVMKDCEEVFVVADRNKIGQVLENMISNAVKYSPVGSTITIACKTVDGHAQLSVTDTGIGIDKKDQEKIFDRFYRVQNEKLKNVSGFGIGLYLVAEILRFHESRIFVDSKANLGSRFYFDLPTSNQSD
jgi:two-component system sensor histidine kinase VicK